MELKKQTKKTKQLGPKMKNGTEQII